MPSAIRPDHLVVLVHGIRTHALWMDTVAPALEEAGFRVGPTSYGKYSLLRFLAPRWMSKRDAVINRVLADIRVAREDHKKATGYYPKKLSVIAHSFGTYVTARILLGVKDLEWHRVIFCGSVIRDDFPFNAIQKRFKPPLLNEIGKNDYWPAFAESAGWGYGSVGSTGFNRPPVVSRWHCEIDHKGFCNRKFCEEYWIRFLKGDDTIDRGEPLELPTWVRLLTTLPLKWIIILIILLPFFLVGIWAAR